VYLAGRDTSPQPPRAVDVPADLVKQLQSAQERLGHALASREEALSKSQEAAAVRAEGSAEVISRLHTAEADLAKRMAVAEGRAELPGARPGGQVDVFLVLAPDVAEDAESLRWQLQALRAHIGALVEGREELALRQSPEALLIEAEAGWETDFLDGLAAHWGIPKDRLPANDFMYLAKDTLPALEARWQRRAHQLETMSVGGATAPVEAALKGAREKLSQITAARAEAPVDLAALFRSTATEDGVRDVPGWVADRLRVRQAEVNERQQHLIQAAQVRDPWNVGLAATANAVDAAAAAGHRQAAWVLDRARAMRPRTLADDDSYIELVKKRITDPAKAAEIEAALRVLWKELQGLNGEARERLLPGELAESFPAWMASRLSDGALVEVKTYLDEARRNVTLQQARLTAGTALSSLDLDFKTVELEAQAIDREIALRAAGQVKAGRQPPADFAPGPQVVSLLQRQARATTTEVLASAAGKQQHWQVLTEYATRVPPNSETKQKLAELWLEGVTAEVARFTEDARRWGAWQDKFSRSGLAGGDGPGAEFREQLKKAQTALDEQAERLRAALTAERADLPGPQVAALIARINEEHGPRPPPDDEPPPVAPVQPTPGNPGPSRSGPGAMVSPYGDGFLRERREQFLTAFAQLEQYQKPSTRPPETRPPLIVLEDDPQRIPYQASRGGLDKPLAPGLRDFRPEGKVPTFEEIDQLKKFNLLPGGVALGRMAVVEGNWADATLYFDAARERLVLSHPDGTYRWLPQTDPAVLKACYLFAHDGASTRRTHKDTVAVSINQVRYTLRLVSLHRALRDTRVGLDAIDADRLPWSLSRGTLPDGKPNPFFEKMKEVLKPVEFRESERQLADRLASRLAPLADLDATTGKSDEVRSKQLLSLAAGIPGGNSDLHAYLKGLGAGEPRGQSGYEEFIGLQRAAFAAVIRAAARQEADQLLKKDPLKRREATRMAVATVQALDRLADADVFKTAVKGLKEAIDATPAEGPAAEARAEQLGLWRAGALLLDKAELQSMSGDPLVQGVLAAQAEVRKLFDLALPERIQFLSELAADAFKSNEPERQVSWDEACQLTLVLTAVPASGGASLRAASADVLHALLGTQLSLITDQPAQWRANGEHALRGEGVLRIRYVRRHADATDNGLRLFEDGNEYPEAGQTATELIPRLEEVYAPLRRLREEAAWIGFFRWALAPGHVRRLSLGGFASVEQRMEKTPDVLLRGDSARYGLTPAPGRPKALSPNQKGGQ
jgi:hypothetical protein